MDLFPKDYKKNDSSLPAANSGSTAISWLKNLKNKLAAGSGNWAVPSRAKETLLRLGVILSGVALLLVLLLWGGLFFYAKSLPIQISDLKRQQSEVFSAKDKEAAVKIVDFDKGAALTQSLLKNHIYSSNIFDKLAAVTMPRVQWQSFNLSVKDSSIVLKGLAADYTILAKQMLALERDALANVKISNISLDKAGGVGFTASGNFDPKILQK